MSVVLDAVNSLFGHHPTPHPPYAYSEAPRARSATLQPKASTDRRTPARSDTPMSSTETRASSSTSSGTFSPPQEHASQQTVVSQPTSPSLALRSTPSSDATSPPAPPPAQSTPTHEVSTPCQPQPVKIKVRDLEHIQSLASENVGGFFDVATRRRSKSRGAAEDRGPQYEISGMKVEHIIEMVAGLLTKITATNDQQHDHLHRPPANLDGSTYRSPQTNRVLAFHGKNVPSITILSYLSRINKYCPTSYEVFLSLLVYFDRMNERVNAGPMQSLRQANEAAIQRNNQSSAASTESRLQKMEGVTATTLRGTQTMTPPASGSMEKAEEPGRPGTPHSRMAHLHDSPSVPPELAVDQYCLSHFFVVDSFNIHRLVIAGVTCASKFFSDIFYTNSRYAKVGGLPLPELNHLELQFLLLNDFRLSVPVEEIEAYGTMLVEFYAREVLAQQKLAQAQSMQQRSLSESSSDSTATVRGV